MNIGNVRAAIAGAFSDLGIRSYGFVPDSPLCPCVYVWPESDDQGEPTDFDGSADPVFIAQFLTGSVVTEGAQEQLDALISTAGDGSAFVALRTDNTFGGVVSSSHARRWRNYGSVTGGDGIRYFSVEIEIKVYDNNTDDDVLQQETGSPIFVV